METGRNSDPSPDHEEPIGAGGIAPFADSLQPPRPPGPSNPLEPGGPWRAASRRAAALAALLVFVSAGYIRNTRPGWNVNTQFALTCAVAELGTLSIDAHHEHPDLATGDKAFFKGRFYCDKSPVTPFLGVPAFLAAKAAVRLAGGNPGYPALRYAVTWMTIGGSAAILAAMLSIWLGRRGLDPARSAMAAAFWIAATPLLGYSILFYQYLPAAAMSLGGALLAEPWLRRDIQTRPRALRLGAAGFLLGLAAWTLPTLALLAAILTGFLLAANPPRRWAALWPWALGGILGWIGDPLYSLSIFGEITSAYRYEYDPKFKEAMARGLMGAAWPDLRVLWLITFHPFRGLFLLFPITLLAAIGAARTAAARGPGRELAAAGLCFLAGLLLYNSGYYMWWGGWAYAPRHLIPALPLLAGGLVPWLAAPPDGRWRLRSLAAWFLLLAGAAVNVMVISLDPQPPSFGVPEERLLHPETVESWPVPVLEILRFVWRGQTDPNWGTALGLRGPASLLPLAAIWVAGSWAAARLNPRGRIRRAG